MATFPLAYLLIPYAIVVAVFIVIALLNVYHLIHYGATTRVSFIFTFIFFAGTVLIFTVSWWLLKDYEWARVVALSLFGQAAPANPTDFGL